MSATVKVYEVVYDTGRGGGAAGDGTAIYRSASKRDAETFAAGKVCYGSAAEVTAADVPRRIAARWRLA